MFQVIARLLITDNFLAQAPVLLAEARISLMLPVLLSVARISLMLPVLLAEARTSLMLPLLFKIKVVLGDLCLRKDDEWDMLLKRTILLPSRRRAGNVA
jgi:hypothetical protein